jgi:hypothetical protein
MAVVIPGVEADDEVEWLMQINSPTHRDADTSEAIPFKDAAPRSGDYMGPADRMDPFWSGLWATADGGVSISWRSRRSVANLNKLGFTSSRANEQRYTQEEAIQILTDRRPRVEMLGAINLWRTATTEQLAAITGRLQAVSQIGTDLSVLWDAGLVQRGRYHDGFQRLRDVPDLFRPDNRIRDRHLENLNYRDWIGVTGGSDSVYSHQFDRHNVLTTELALRAAELCALRGVAGESIAGWSKLFPPELEPNPHRAADAVLVRHDGSRILLEMTVTVSSATVTKVKQLADLLARDPTGKTSAIFVVAAHPSSSESANVALLARKAVAKATSQSMNNVLAKVANRIGVVRWKDWFPSEGFVSPNFFHLSALTATGQPEDLWQSTEFLNPLDGAFAPEPTDGLNDLYGVPHWMRFKPTDFSQHLLASAGLPTEYLNKGAA